MHFCKENKSPSSHEKIPSNYFSFEECKTNVNILESIIEYILTIEQTLREIMQQNISLKNQIQKNEEYLINESEQEKELMLKNYSQGKNYVEQLEKIINKFKITINKDNITIEQEANNEKEKNTNNINDNYKNKLEISDEIREIKNYYEGKINIMEKKIKVFEILENLYISQTDELKKKLTKNASNKLKKINENLMVYDFH